MGASVIPLDSWSEIERRELYTVLRRGQVIAYPTDTIYGLGVDVYHAGAVAALQRMKGRDSQKPISILYSSTERMLRDFNHLSDFQSSAIQALLPGSVTLLLPIKSENQFPAAFTQNGIVGVRVVNLPALNALLADYPHPISTTSINPAARKPAASLAEIQQYFPNEIRVIIDNGFMKNTQASTIIKLLEDGWEIIREGAMPSDAVNPLLKSLK